MGFSKEVAEKAYIGANKSLNLADLIEWIEAHPNTEEPNKMEIEPKQNEER